MRGITNAAAIAAVGLVAACGDNAEPVEDTTVAEGIFAPLGEPMPSATPAQLGTFARGRAVSLRRFAPDDGAGPHFNVTFCGACHEKPVAGGGAGHYRNFLLIGQTLPDGSFVGTGVNGVQAQYTLGASAREPDDPATNVSATRNPIPFFGVGLLAEIPDEEILSRQDPDDADGDGISGRANFDRGFVGRFGRKAQNAAIESFIRGPLFNHLGITTNPLPPHRRAELPVSGAGDVTAQRGPAAPPGLGSKVLHQVGAPDEPIEDTDGVPDPELSEDDLFDLVSFSMLLAAPEPAAPTADSEAGRALFEQANCTGCHVPTLTGPRGRIPAFTDLLIHDMGSDLDDGIKMGEASGAEFRTAPLWGVCAVGPWLHDGRADSLDEAIRLHGGEAEASRDAYVAMSDTQREQVIAFLESLGGKEQVTPGLLPPGAPVLAAGEYGGPMVELAGGDLDQFERGRAVFDGDFGGSTGLGPFFNGDACRACHFDPVIGGSGPSDVDVIRHGIVDPVTEAFTEPSIGTMAHRHAEAPGVRPPIDEAANFFEARQTPPIFGFGLVDLIADDTILALEDPDDLDGDGISGRAHVLPDGRIGRLGWKANVPSLAEFSRDGMFNEIGMTMPDQPGLTFGGAEDGDDIPDPEITVEMLEDLTFFMASLAPPPRTRFDEALEDTGEQVFEDIGCANCHVPVLQTRDGDDVPLYSDLLLHDVSLPWQLGIEAGDAGIREFRTSPLWGLARTAPYMHDGAAATVEQAILLHGSEATDARDGFLNLPPDLQAALIAFLQSL